MFCRLLVSLTFGLALAGNLSAQATGSLVGRVLDASTGKYLEGADITVSGTALHTTSERGGSFALGAVPTGAQQVTATYPGLDAMHIPVTVAADGPTVVEVNFNSEVVKLEAFHVAGMKEGSAQAVALQKAAVNMKVVAAGDQYGDIAEGNAAEYLKFLPGVGIDYNANDARAVSLRGMNTQFTDVTMNGSPIASATSGNLNRRFEFEQLSISNVETIEVIKTLTPDLPATGTAGLINMVTKSAFDRAGDLFTYRLYLQGLSTELTTAKTPGWGQELTHKITPGIDLNYAKHITKNLGINISYKLSELVNDYPRSSYTWDYNPADGGTPTNPAMTSWNLQNEQKITKRQGGSVQLDYKLGDSTKLSLLGDWTYYNLFFTDRTLTVNTGTLAALSTTSPVITGNTVAGLANKGSVTLSEIFRNKSGVTWHFPFNLTHDFADGSKLELAAYWSQAYSHYRDTTGGYFSDVTMQRGGTSPQTNSVTDPLTVAFNNIGGTVPSYSVTDVTNGGAANLQDLTKYQVTQIRSRPQTGVDTKDGGGVSYTKIFKTKMPLSVKVGLVDDYTTRNIVDPIWNRTGTSAATGFGGASAITGSQLAGMGDTSFANRPIGYGLPAFTFPSVYKAYAQLGGQSYLPYTPASDIRARFEDETRAYYARLDFTPVENVLIVGGVRYEDRLTNSTNSLLTLATPATGVFADKSWFPSVNLKYTPNKDLVFRLGYSKSIGLPDYSDLLPGPATITDPVGTTRGKISIYNSALKAYQIDNFDAGASYYFSNTSVFSVSVFRKKLTNYIITGTAGLDAATAAALGLTNTLGFPPDQYDITTKFNVKAPGYYQGVELGYAQNFNVLPKPFGTLNVQANATFMGISPIHTSQVFSTTDANLNAAIQQQVNLNLALATVKQSFNLSLSTTLGKFAFNVESNYAGRQLKALSQKTVKYSDVAVNQYFNEQQFQAARELIDVRVDYRLNSRITPYFQVRNILGRPIVFETSNLPFNHAEYGDPIYELGVRGVW